MVRNLFLAHCSFLTVCLPMCLSICLFVCLKLLAYLFFFASLQSNSTCIFKYFRYEIRDTRQRFLMKEGRYFYETLVLGDISGKPEREIARYEFGRYNYFTMDYKNSLIYYTTSFDKPRLVGPQYTINAMKTDGSYRHIVLDQSRVSEKMLKQLKNLSANFFCLR